MSRARSTAALMAVAAVSSILMTPAVGAAPTGLPVAVVVSSAQPQIQVVGQSTRTLTPAEFAELRGEYRLQGGGALVLGGARHRPVAELNDKAPVALLPMAPNQLVSTDGTLRLEFQTLANGEVSQLTLHVVASAL
jgi:hypothetical protein